jgi:DNA-binding winged helix-turn-helix (wHTH) protein
MPQTDDAGSGPRGPFRLGEWLVEPSLNRLTRGDDTVALEPRLMDLLLLLARHPGEVLSPEATIDAVWAQQFVGEGLLRRAVASLREALGDDAKAPTYIETISKRGYRLIAEPVPVGGEMAPVSLDETERVAVGSAWLRPRLLASTLGAVLLFGVVSVGVWRARQSTLPGAGPNEPKRLVVLPFMNLGPSEHEYFADGMTVELINRLATASGLHVISNTTAMK